MKKGNRRGFTLVELLVTIAIIGILSTVAMSSLGTAREKAFDAKVKAQLSNIRSAAETYYSTNFNYGMTTSSCTAGMFADTITGMSKLTVSANYPVGENTIVCNAISTPPSYAVSDNFLASSTYWCVDSSGASKPETNPLGSSTVCE